MKAVMPAPTDLKTLVDPKFNFFDGWDYEFGQYRWFYTAGYVELMADAKFKRRNRDLDIIKKHCEVVPHKVPKEWKELYSDEDYSKDWKSIAHKQIEFSVKRKPQKFAKAAMSCMCLERALRKNNNLELDAYSQLEIRPAIFYIDGFSEIFVNIVLGDEELRSQLIGHALQEKVGVFKDMAEGFTVTHQTAARTLEFLKSKLSSDQTSGLTVEYITERSVIKQPAKQENIVMIRPNNVNEV